MQEFWGHLCVKLKGHEIGVFLESQSVGFCLCVLGKFIFPELFVQLYYNCIRNFCWNNSSGTSFIDLMGQEA